MAGRRRSSDFVKKAAVLFLFLICNLNRINAKNYIVGDDVGWTVLISMETWPDGKTCYAGDVLEFKYPTSGNETPVSENVVVTDDEEGFLSCSINDNSTIYTSGDDKLVLPFGQNYFMGGNLHNHF